MTETPVDAMFLSYKDMMAILSERGELTLINAMEDQFRKAMLLSAASLFEHELRVVVARFAEEQSGNSLIVSLIKSKVIERQYHTWFDWGAKNANAFFSMFGNDFSVFMKKQTLDKELDGSIKSFLELGQERNRLVHQNYGSFVLEKTVDEIYVLFKIAKKFVDDLPSLLRECPKHGASK
jgi:hypothetical protein